MKSSAGLSSKDLIANIQRQKLLEPADTLSITKTPEDEGREKMIQDLRDFLYGVGGKATTAALVDHFKLRITHDEAPILRSMLKSIASFDKTKKQWILKDEFL